MGSGYFYLVSDNNGTSAASASNYFCGMYLTGKIIIARNLAIVTTGAVTFPRTNGTTWSFLMTRQGATISCTLVDGSGTNETITYTDSSPVTGGQHFGFLTNTVGANYLYIDDYTVGSIE